ncbi:MAG: acireductone synthase [Spirochaetia bacterium]|nr:acireductone synthase [Spirochaetia bacterium]
MIRAVLTDIEGTTSSLSFVKDVLFPYARKHIAEFVQKHYENPSIQPSLSEIRKETGKDLNQKEIIETLISWIDQDRKITPLKTLQGILWEEGYKNRDFFGHIYEDAKENLEKWKNENLLLYVYSSGSVYAQKLLFANTEFGDLTWLFSGHFDTTSGQKKDSSSYNAIASSTGLEPETILFLSDIREELAAASQAGMRVCLLAREGIPDPEFHTVQSFNEIHPSSF